MFRYYYDVIEYANETHNWTSKRVSRVYLRLCGVFWGPFLSWHMECSKVTSVLYADLLLRRYKNLRFRCNEPITCL